MCDDLLLLPVVGQTDPCRLGKIVNDTEFVFSLSFKASMKVLRG